MHISQKSLALAVLAWIIALAPGHSQTLLTAGQPELSTTGVVASQSPNTLVVKTASNQFILFVYDTRITKPSVIPYGATVNIISSRREDGVQVAHYVWVTSPPPAQGTPTAEGAKPATSPGGGAAQSGNQEVIPESVKDLERGINKQAKRYHGGVQGGVGLDPEVVLLGLNARLGPIFNSDVYFRPNVDFGFGEVTKMFQINLDVTYRLPLSPRTGPWSVYIGSGPNFSFVSQNFSKAASGDNSVDFSDFSFKAGLNILAGMEYRSGLFYEMKAGVWTIPTLRFIVGYHF